jgi:hypothetical protein
MGSVAVAMDLGAIRGRALILDLLLDLLALAAALIAIGAVGWCLDLIDWLRW